MCEAWFSDCRQAGRGPILGRCGLYVSESAGDTGRPAVSKSEPAAIALDTLEIHWID